MRRTTKVEQKRESSARASVGMRGMIISDFFFLCRERRCGVGTLGRRTFESERQTNRKRPNLSGKGRRDRGGRSET